MLLESLPPLAQSPAAGPPPSPRGASLPRELLVPDRSLVQGRPAGEGRGLRAWEESVVAKAFQVRRFLEREGEGQRESDEVGRTITRIHTRECLRARMHSRAHTHTHTHH